VAGKAGRSGAPGKTRPAGPGRNPTKAIIRAGDNLMISQVYPGGMADLGRGRASVTRIGNSRLITVLQADGSEIRIVLVKP
jgi:hypothetical protein